LLSLRFFLSMDVLIQLKLKRLWNMSASYSKAMAHLLVTSGVSK